MPWSDIHIIAFPPKGRQGNSGLVIANHWIADVHYIFRLDEWITRKMRKISHWHSTWNIFGLKKVRPIDQVQSPPIQDVYSWFFFQFIYASKRNWLYLLAEQPQQEKVTVFVFTEFPYFGASSVSLKARMTRLTSSALFFVCATSIKAKCYLHPMQSIVTPPAPRLLWKRVICMQMCWRARSGELPWRLWVIPLTPPKRDYKRLHQAFIQARWTA